MVVNGHPSDVHHPYMHKLCSHSVHPHVHIEWIEKDAHIVFIIIMHHQDVHLE